MTLNRIARLAAPAALAAGALVIAARGDDIDPPAPIARATPRADDGPRWKKPLPASGIEIELLGVEWRPWPLGENPGDPAWTTPDGRPMARAPFRGLMTPPTAERADVVQAAFAFRVTGPGLEKEPIDLVWDVPGVKQTGAWLLLGTNRDDHRICAYGAAYPKGRRKGTVRLGTALGDWKTVASCSGKAVTTATTESAAVIFSEARATDEGVALNLVGMASRGAGPGGVAVALGPDGREVEAASTSATAGVDGPFLGIETTFKLPPDGVRGFRLQERPYEWAEFVDVALPETNPPKP